MDDKPSAGDPEDAFRREPTDKGVQRVVTQTRSLVRSAKIRSEIERLEREQERKRKPPDPN
jgi:hypothetical protein